jgi:hypothetical protein
MIDTLPPLLRGKNVLFTCSFLPFPLSFPLSVSKSKTAINSEGGLGGACVFDICWTNSTV